MPCIAHYTSKRISLCSAQRIYITGILPVVSYQWQHQRINLHCYSKFSNLPSFVAVTDLIAAIAEDDTFAATVVRKWVV